MTDHSMPGEAAEMPQDAPNVQEGTPLPDLDTLAAVAVQKGRLHGVTPLDRLMILDRWVTDAVSSLAETVTVIRCELLEVARALGLVPEDTPTPNVDAERRRAVTLMIAQRLQTEIDLLDEKASPKAGLLVPTPAG